MTTMDALEQLESRVDQLLARLEMQKAELLQLRAENAALKQENEKLIAANHKLAGFLQRDRAARKEALERIDALMRRIRGMG